MRIGFVTNDFFDAVHSRLKMSKWMFTNKGIQISVASPQSSLNVDGIWFYKSRGLNLDNINNINRYVRKNDIVIYRGIELILLSLFINHRGKKVFFLLTGLGKAFTYNGRFKSLIRLLYRLVLCFCIKKNNAQIIFQNKEDPDELRIKNYHLMRGSGHTRKYTIPEIDSKINNVKIITCTRLSKSKGLDDILSFAHLVSGSKGLDYIVCGDYSNLDLKYRSRIRNLNRYHNIHFKGFCEDVEAEIMKCQYAFFPTRYREGSPRFLIEAASYGLNLITTKMPGCSFFIDNNVAYHYNNASCVIEWIYRRSYDDYIKCKENTIKFYENNFISEIVFEDLYKILKS